LKNEGFKRREIRKLIYETPKRYLNVLKFTENQMMTALGKENIKTQRAEEMLHEVIADLIDGTRKWDPEKHNLEQVMMMNLKSEIDGLKKKEKRYILVDTCEDEETGCSMIDKLIHSPPLDIEGGMDAEELLNYIINVIFEGQRTEQTVVYELTKWKTQKQIAKYLNISVDKAEILIAKVRRNIRKKLPISYLENIPINLLNKIFRI
jgi:hypothetical protein